MAADRCERTGNTWLFHPPFVACSSTYPSEVVPEDPPIRKREIAGDAPNFVSGLIVAPEDVTLELFQEPFLCAPVAMDNTLRLLESPLLQLLFRKYGRPHYEAAEEEFRMALAMRQSVGVPREGHL